MIAFRMVVLPVPGPPVSTMTLDVASRAHGLKLFLGQRNADRDTTFSTTSSALGNRTDFGEARMRRR